MLKKLIWLSLILSWVVSGACVAYASKFWLVDMTAYTQWNNIALGFITLGMVLACTLWWLYQTKFMYRVVGLLPIMAVYTFMALLFMGGFQYLFT